MIDLAFVILLSIISGAVVGIVPGLTSVIGLMAMMPFIASFTVPEIIVFWVCFLSVSQYYGSIGALLLKVPGETSSLPVLVSSIDLKMAKSIIRSYKITSYSSYIASLIGIALLAALLYLLQDSWYILFSLKFTVSFLAIALILLIVSKRQYKTNILLILVGTLIAWFPESDTAINFCGKTGWGCIALNPTDFGLVIVGLYAVPFLFEKSSHFAHRKPSTSSVSWTQVAKFKFLAAKYAIYGFFVGLTPGMGITLSSNIAASAEVAKNQYRKLSQMAAAESANNSAAISCTVPFLLLGLPITGTELFLDNWLRVFKAYNVNYELLMIPVNVLSTSIPLHTVLLSSLLITCSICFLLTSRFINVYLKLQKIPPRAFDVSIKLIIVIVSAYAFSIAVESGWTVPIITLIAFSAIGIWAHRKNIDVIALPVAIVVGKFAVDKFITAYTLWS